MLTIGTYGLSMTKAIGIAVLLNETKSAKSAPYRFACRVTALFPLALASSSPKRKPTYIRFHHIFFGSASPIPFKKKKKPKK